MKAEEIVHLAAVTAKPKVEIGSRYTGKREVHYDTRTGTYSESKVSLDFWARVLQAALCPPTLNVRRKPENIRQKP
jgi:hypothetical protein